MKDICMVLSICMNIGMPACLAADLSIDEAVDMALAKNNDVKIANEEKWQHKQIMKLQKEQMV